MNIEILKIESNTVYAAPADQLLNSFKEKEKSLDQILIDGFMRSPGVVMEAGGYLTGVYHFLSEKYPDHKIVFRKDDGSFIRLYYESAKHICGGFGTKSGVKFTCFIER